MEILGELVVDSGAGGGVWPSFSLLLMLGLVLGLFELLIGFSAISVGSMLDSVII